MIRRLRAPLSLALALAVQGGAVSALFLHAHVDADHDHHHSTVVHAHFASHVPARAAQDGISVEGTERDHAIYLHVFVAVEPLVFQSPDIAQTTFMLAPVVERALPAPVVVSHAHDPPLVSALDSRPPPVSPVLI